MSCSFLVPLSKLTQSCQKVLKGVVMISRMTHTTPLDFNGMLSKRSILLLGNAAYHFETLRLQGKNLSKYELGQMINILLLVFQILQFVDYNSFLKVSLKTSIQICRKYFSDVLLPFKLNL